MMKLNLRAFLKLLEIGSHLIGRREGSVHCAAGTTPAANHLVLL